MHTYSTRIEKDEGKKENTNMGKYEQRDKKKKTAQVNFSPGKF